MSLSSLIETIWTSLGFLLFGFFTIIPIIYFVKYIFNKDKDYLEGVPVFKLSKFYLFAGNMSAWLGAAVLYMGTYGTVEDPYFVYISVPFIFAGILLIFQYSSLRVGVVGKYLYGHDFLMLPKKLILNEVVYVEEKYIWSHENNSLIFEDVQGKKIYISGYFVGYEELKDHFQFI